MASSLEHKFNCASSMVAGSQVPEGACLHKHCPYTSMLNRLKTVQPERVVALANMYIGLMGACVLELEGYQRTSEKLQLIRAAIEEEKAWIQTISRIRDRAIDVQFDW